MTNGDRVPGTRLRRFAERTFDRETLDRVILPALADLQHESSAAESGRLWRQLTSLRAYWGIWKTIGWCLVGDAVRDREGTTASLGRRTIVFLPMLVAVLMAPSAWWMFGFASKHGARPALTAGAFLIPASLLVALPAAFFLAVAMYRARADQPSTRLLPSALAGSVACAVVVLALLMVVVPASNQAFRSLVFQTFNLSLPDAPRGPLRKGLPEMTWLELNEHIRHAPSNRQADLARAHRQQRFAFVGSVFVLGLLGLGVAGRWRSRVVTLGAALALLAVYGVCFGLGAGLNNGGYPSTYGVWTANGAFFVIGLRLLRSRREALPC